MLIFLLGFQGTQNPLSRTPASPAEYSGCDPKEASLAIRNQAWTPGTSLFHYGKRDLLMKDVAAHTIPEADWNEFIMGETTRFKLKRFRRGFYGTEFPEDADRFGDDTYNWMVEVVLKPECRIPSKVASLVYLPDHPAFRSWYSSSHQSISFESWKKECFDSAGYPHFHQFHYYKNPNESADFEETTCEKTVGDYFEFSKLALVQDHVGDLVRSWAIRDRNCIQDIRGSDQYWAQEFTRRPDFWKNSCNRERNHRNLIRVWFVALSNAGTRLENLKRFREMILKVPPPENHLDWQTEEEDRFAAQDFAVALESTYSRCGDSKKQEFSETLREISDLLDGLQSDEVKTRLEKACR